MSENHQPVLLVTGASGHLGQRVIELLLEKQAGKIIATTRTPEKLADFASKGVEVRHADFNDPASLEQAFAGVDRLLLISTDTVGEPGARVKQHTAAVEAAAKAGVKHVLYTSITNPVNSPVILAADHAATEAALEATSLGWTLLRNNIYTEMLLGTLSQALKLGGQIFAAAGNGKTAYVTREDCAQAAAGALTDGFEGRRALDITGPQALSQADIAAIGTELLGKPITYVSLSLEVLVQNMVGAGLPQPVAEVYASFDTGIAQGKFTDVTNNVQALSGRPAISVRDFLAAHRDVLLQGAPTH